MAGGQAELWLPADPRSAGTARRAIREMAERADLTPEEVYDVTLAGSEAVANAIEHGSPCKKRGVRLRVRVEDGSLIVEVSDCGTFPATSEGSPDRGRGLPIIGALADVVELNPGPEMTVLRLAKHASMRSAAA
jgi:serine/threonine-protein kinase RsbW